MKTAYSYFEKGHGIQKKKKVFMNKIKTNVLNKKKKKLVRPTNSVLQT